MKKLTTLLCALALVVGFVSVMPLHAQKGPSETDKQFLQKASEGGMAEVKLGELAEQKAQNPLVKAFGHRMVTDHTALNNQMKPFVEAWGLTPPTSLDSESQALYDKLSGLFGADFDKEYMNAMVEDHKKDLSDFTQETQETKDAKFKKTVMHGKSVIASHLKEAEAIHAKVG